MNIFAIDSAKQTVGIAVRQDNKLIYESYAAMQITHSETLLSLCDDAFNATNLTPNLINLFAVTKGPGSFTGLRIGIGIVKGMAFCQNTPCIGISTLKALAQSVPFSGYIAATINARRDNVYCALFKKDENGLHRITNDELLHKSDFCAKAFSICSSENYSGNILCIGDGTPLINGGIFVALDDDILMGRAGAIAKLAQIASQQGKTVTPQSLMPDYLLLTQAERMLIEKNSL